MAKNVFVSKSGHAFKVAMSNTQQTFVPHWITRFTADFVTDLNEHGANITTHRELDKFLFDAVNEKLNGVLVYDEYCFRANSALRNHGIIYTKDKYPTTTKKQPKADTTTTESDDVQIWIHNCFKSGFSEAQIKQQILKQHGKAVVDKYFPPKMPELPPMPTIEKPSVVTKL